MWCHVCTEVYFHESPMGVTRSVHVKAHLLDSVLNIRTRQCEVLKRTYNGAVEGSVGRRRALDGGHLSLRSDRSGSRLAIKHARSLQKLVGVLLLVQKEASSPAHYLDAEEVVESPQVLEGELITKTSSQPLKEVRGGRREDDVVDVEQQICSVSSLMIHKE